MRTAGAGRWRPRRIGAAVVAVLALVAAGGWQVTAAQALPRCSGSNPAPACGGDGGGDGGGGGGGGGGTPTPTATPLGAPDIHGGGSDTTTSFSLVVAPQSADWLAATHLTIQQAPSSSGPWSDWRDLAVAPDSATNLGYRRFYVLSGTYIAPMATPCFRARVARAAGTPSGWSPVKCMTSAPVATDVSVPYWVPGTSTQVTWTDNSVNDQTYYLQVTRPDGTNTLTSVPGTPGNTGTRRATIPLRPDDSGCVTVWARDWLTGNVRYLPNESVWLPSTPMTPTITPSAGACFQTPPS